MIVEEVLQGTSREPRLSVVAPESAGMHRQAEAVYTTHLTTKERAEMQRTMDEKIDQFQAHLEKLTDTTNAS